MTDIEVQLSFAYDQTKRIAYIGPQNIISVITLLAYNVKIGIEIELFQAKQSIFWL